MLKINPDPQFTVDDLQITVPGKKEPVKVSMTFKYKNREQLVDFFKSIVGKPYDEVIPDILTGWSGFDAAYSPESLKELLLNYPSAGSEIVSQYESLSLASRIKN